MGQQQISQARGLLALREEKGARAAEARTGHPAENLGVLEGSGLRKDFSLVMSQERLRITGGGGWGKWLFSDPVF